MELEQREFRSDPLKLKRLRIAASMSVKDFQEASGLNKDTARKILRGDPVFLSSLSLAMSDAFGIENPLEVLHPHELAELGVQTEVPATSHILEWDIDAYLSGWEKTSNGLQYQLVKLRHRFLDGRFARGKCYELRHLTSAEQERVEAYLHRHAKVCEQIGQHPHIASNLTAALVGGLWWVLDRWEEGETLADRFSTGPLSDYQLRLIMTGIAKGLAELHKSQVIRRELSPRSVLLRESDDRPILTDMELAKLVAGHPTVSPDEWPDDPYRALEVVGETPFDVRADIYSWGRLFVHGATGQLCDRGKERLPRNKKIPQVVREIVMQSVEVLPSQRPDNMRAILKALKVWE